MATHTVDSLIADILRREGGFVDHKDDRGGATNHGISLRYALGIGLDLDGDGDTDEDDIRLVSPAEAAMLYKRDFFEQPKIATLPSPLHPVLFDWAVNSGPPTPIRYLQRIMLATGHLTPAPRADDGVIGPKTRRAADAAWADMDAYLVNAICEERRNFYQKIVKNDPSQKAFIKGWLRRADEFVLPVPEAV
jgi:lysozyme family protein